VAEVFKKISQIGSSGLLVARASAQLIPAMFVGGDLKRRDAENAEIAKEMLLWAGRGLS